MRRRLCHVRFKEQAWPADKAGNWISVFNGISTFILFHIYLYCIFLCPLVAMSSSFNHGIFLRFIMLADSFQHQKVPSVFFEHAVSATTREADEKKFCGGK